MLDEIAEYADALAEFLKVSYEKNHQINVSGQMVDRESHLRREMEAVGEELSLTKKRNPQLNRTMLPSQSSLLKFSYGWRL